MMNIGKRTFIYIIIICGILYLKSNFIITSSIYLAIEIILSILIPLLIYKRKISLKSFFVTGYTSFLGLLFCFYSLLYIYAQVQQKIILLKPQVVDYLPSHGYKTSSGIKINMHGSHVILPYTSKELDSLFSISNKEKEDIAIDLYIKKISPDIYYISDYKVHWSGKQKMRFSLCFIEMLFAMKGTQDYTHTKAASLLFTTTLPT